MDILVIGGEGYIGKVLIKDLVKKYRVTSLDNLMYGQNRSIIHKNYSFLNIDIRNFGELKKILKKFDTIVLLAGLVGDPISKKYYNLANDINDHAITKIINFCSDINTKRFIFTSTCSNYGNVPANSDADEQTELKPLSYYAKSKVAAERLIMSKKNLTSMNPTILRFATAFGISPRMRFDLTISEFVKELFLGKELEIFYPNTWRPYCHVNDFSLLIQKIITAPLEKISFEIYNAGSNENNASKQIILDKILKFIPNGSFKYIKSGDDLRNYKVNFDKVFNELEFKPKYSIEYGINELINSFKEDRFSDVEKNILNYGNYEIK